MITIRKVRSTSYRIARDLGNVEAIEQSFKTGSPKPLVKRAVRRAAYRGTNRWLSRVLKALGL